MNVKHGTELSALDAYYYLLFGGSIQTNEEFVWIYIDSSLYLRPIHSVGKWAESSSWKVHEVKIWTSRIRAYIPGKDDENQPTLWQCVTNDDL